jgi:hypothetical protein
LPVPFGCEACEYLLDYADTVPASKLVVDHLVWAALSRSVSPSQPVTDKKQPQR